MSKKIFLVVMTAVASLAGCEEDEQTPSQTPIQKTVINFINTPADFLEADEKNTISISFDKPVQLAGTITINVSSTKLESFAFSPEPENGKLLINVAEGANAASFDVMSTDNALIDGNKTLSFEIVDVTEGFTPGTRKTLVSHWVDDETPAIVSFDTESTSLRENNEAGSLITLSLSHAAPGDGTISLTLQEDTGYGTTFTTEPSMTDGTLQLAVASGATSVSFNVLPVDNALFSDSYQTEFTLESATGSLEKGSGNAHAVTIIDDELEGMAKKFTTPSPMGLVSRTLTYSENGKLNFVAWVSGAKSGVDTYTYSEAGELTKVIMLSGFVGREVTYIYENGKVVKTEEHVNGVLRKYSLFGYDDTGNIGEVVVYDRQPDASFINTLHFIYLYHTNGNLYTKLTYQPVGDDYELLSEDIYEDYLDKENQFGIMIIPGNSIQRNLPLTYTHKTGDTTLNYTITYQFYPNGKAESRTVVGPTTVENTQYEYY